MLRWIRLLAIVGVGLMLLWAVLAWYVASERREALEREWARRGLEGDRDAWIEAELAPFVRRARRVIGWILFVLPVLLVTAAIVVVNFLG